MSGNGGSGGGTGGGIAVIIGIIAALVGSWFFAPSIFNIIKIIGIIALIIIVGLIVLLIVLSNKASNDDIKQKKIGAGGNVNLSEENAQILRKGREDLMNLRRMMMRVKNMEIRGKGNEVCGLIDKILQTLREKSEKIPYVRQFFNYYLPTLSAVITKFERIEDSGVPSEDMAAKVSAYLTDVRSAMNKQYENLFADDVLDMTVDMEAMTMAVKRDGLLDSDQMKIQQ